VKKLISIISPVYNEGEGLETYFAEMCKAISTRRFAKYAVEVILVDNASTDDSPAYLEAIAAKDSRFKVILNARNVGPYRSTFNALGYARGDAVFLLVPSDLQDPPELMDQMLAKWEEGYLLVAGRRLERQESKLMSSLRLAFYNLVAKIADQNMEPGVGEYQLADRLIVDELLDIPDALPFVRGMLGQLGYKPFIIDYEWKRRRWGKTNFSIGKLFRTAYDMIFSFSQFPLRVIMVAGIVIAALSLLFALVQIAVILIEGRVAGRGISTLIIALFFFSGLNAVFMGVIGEYVGRIYHQTRYGRRVAVRRLINFDRKTRARAPRTRAERPSPNSPPGRGGSAAPPASPRRRLSE
jgi:polyisoprenyl-phosphate glycosyltransferase